MKTKWNVLVGLIMVFVLPSALFAEPTRLRMAFQDSEQSHGYVHALAPWVKQVAEATKGQVLIEIFPSQTLTKGKDTYDAVKNGIADMAWCFYGYWPGLTPLTDVISLPGLPFKTAEKGSAVLWQLYEKFPVIQREFAATQPLLLFTSDPYTLITTKKWVKTLEDIKGLKLRMTGGPPTSMVSAMGGTPMLIAMPEVYLSLQKGVLDGMGCPWEAMHAFKFYETINFYTEVPFPAVYFSFSMNKAKWNGLSKELQDAVMSVSGLEGSKFCGHNFFDTAKDVVVKDIQAAGKQLNYYVLPEKERARWLEVGGKPIWAAWVKEMETKGHKDARTILDTCLELSK
jgi:TRAP-type C4-dicarboxylate transport system substrate-binding protein